MHRIFIAINLPDNVKQVLVETLTKLKKVYSRAPIRFVKADGFHITLHFLGDQSDETIEKVKTILQDVVGRYRPTKLVLDGFGFFPNATRPRVLWIGAAGAGAKILQDLQKDLSKELQKLGLYIDTRKWHPHITLGRISGTVNTTILHSIVAPNSPFSKGGEGDFEKEKRNPSVEWRAGSVELMESKLLSQGAEYKVLHSAKLY